MNPLAAALVLPPLALLAVAARALLRRPRVLAGEPKPALILAAHQDDCAILAGAYGIRAVKAGRRVQVAYLTCGAPSPELPRAVTRKAESLAAWAKVGVPNEDVLFFGLPEHDVSAVSTWTQADRDRARGWLAGLMRALPRDAAVFVPAAGEAHVDHRALRRLALEAWRELQRGDLLFLEGPEYNDYLSLLQSPAKVGAVFAAAVPVLWRLFRRDSPPWTGFAQGGACWALPPDAALMEERRSLLRGFVSENGDLLVRLFGRYERYRPIAEPAAGLAEEPPRGYVSLGGHHRGFSALLLLLVWAEAVASAAWAASSIALPRLGTGAGRVVISAAALGAVAFGARRRLKMDSRVLYFALGLGALAAAVGVP